MIWTLLLLCLFLISGGVEILAEYLNYKSIDKPVPTELKSHFSENDPTRTQYQKETILFGLKQDAFFLLVTLLFLGLGGFGFLDQQLSSFTQNEILKGILFVFSLSILKFILTIPFSYAFTFGIETRFGFNKTTLKTFILDRIKGGAIALILGSLVLWVFFSLFLKFTENFWLYAWIFLVGFQFLMSVLAPIVFMPLFNKFEELKEGDLKKELFHYAQKVGFGLGGIFSMDGSKRSSKSNAFFTGFGKFRKLVLFDTLLEKLDSKEVLAVFAHEVGHSKRKHILKGFLLSTLMMLGVLFLVSLLFQRPELYEAFQITTFGSTTGLICAMMVLDPLLKPVSLLNLALSRKYEFEADRYSVDTAKLPEAMCTSLIKLSKDHHSHLNPHPLVVLLSYTHPPVLQRVTEIKKYAHLV